MHDRKDDTPGTSEMKAFGEELLATGARYIDAGRRWLSERRDQMASRDGDEDRHAPGPHGGRRAYRDGGARRRRAARSAARPPSAAWPARRDARASDR